MSQLKKVFKTFIAKEAVRNGMWLYILQFFNSVVPVLSLPYITRILGKEGFGIFSYSLNIIGYLTVVVEYGFNFSATRKVSLLCDQKELGNTFSSILAARLVLTFLSFFFLNICFLIFPIDLLQKLCSYVLFLSILGTALQQTWLFQGLQKMYYITLLSVVSRIISLILTFQFVKIEDDILLYCFLYSITPLLIGIMGIYVSLKLLKGSSFKFNLSDVFTELKNGWYIFTTSLSSKVFSAIGITILGIVSTKEQVGIYSAIQKIPTVLLLMWSPISQVLYPISSKKMKTDFNKGCQWLCKIKYFICIAFGGISIIIALFSKLIVSVAFGKDYAESFYLLIPLLLWMNVGIWNNFSGIQTLLAGGYDKVYSKCFQISVIGTIILNILLINLYGTVGAAFAPLLSELLLFVLLNNSLKKL